MRSAQQIFQLLASSKKTTLLLKQVALNKRLTSLLQANLPSPLADYCQAGELGDHSFTIITTSPVWAAKLRYLLPGLQKSLNQHKPFAQVTEINIKISNFHNAEPAREAPRRQARMTPQSAEAIEQMAATVSDPALRESLLRLSRHGKKSDKPEE